MFASLCTRAAVLPFDSELSPLYTTSHQPISSVSLSVFRQMPFYFLICMTSFIFPNFSQPSSPSNTGYIISKEFWPASTFSKKCNSSQILFTNLIRKQFWKF